MTLAYRPERRLGRTPFRAQGKRMVRSELRDWIVATVKTLFWKGCRDTNERFSPRVSIMGPTSTHP